MEKKVRKFDTKVQHLKYKVLREVARLAWDGRLMEGAFDIPKTIVPGKVPTMRCCVYKERAILAERVKLAMGGDEARSPSHSGDRHRLRRMSHGRLRGCPPPAAAVSYTAVRRPARRAPSPLTIIQKGAYRQKQVHGMRACAKVCPYSAITDHKRPCETRLQGEGDLHG